MKNNYNTLNDALLIKYTGLFARYEKHFYNNESNNKFTNIKNLRYNFLLRAECIQLDNIKFKNLQTGYEALFNLLGEERFYKNSWKIVFDSFNITVKDEKLEIISNFFNNSYLDNYVKNIYQLWNLLFELSIDITSLEFSIFILFSLSYFYNFISEKKENFLLLFVMRVLKDNEYSHNQDSFIVLLNDILSINERALLRLLEFEKNLVFNTKSKVSQKALYVLMHYGGIAENDDIRKHINNTKQAVNRLLNSIMNIDSNIVVIEKKIKKEEPNRKYNFFRSNFIINFLSKGI